MSYPQLGIIGECHVHGLLTVGSEGHIQVLPHACLENNLSTELFPQVILPAFENKTLKLILGVFYLYMQCIVITPPLPQIYVPYVSILPDCISFINLQSSICALIFAWVYADPMIMVDQPGAIPLKTLAFPSPGTVDGR